MNGSLAVPGRLDGEYVSLAALHEASRHAHPYKVTIALSQPTGTRILKLHMRWSVAARPQQIVRAAPQRDRDMAPARPEFGASAISSRPATFAKPGDAALHRCGLQGGADHLESPALVKAGALDHRIENGSGELAEDHFDCGVCAEAPINAQRARLLTLTRASPDLAACKTLASQRAQALFCDPSHRHRLHFAARQQIVQRQHLRR